MKENESSGWFSITKRVIASKEQQLVTFIRFIIREVRFITAKTPNEKTNMKKAICISALAVMSAFGSVAMAYDTPTTLPSERPHLSNAKAPIWNKDAVYTKGDRVRFLGRVWIAKWWTQGDRPNKDKESGPWHALTFYGDKPTTKLPRYKANVKYQAGDKVRGKDQRIYRCKEWPATPWCQLKAYAPGDSAHWRDAWDRIL